MKTMLVLSMGALLLAGTLSAQTPVPEWQAGVDKMKSLIQTNPAQASEEVGELLKGMSYQLPAVAFPVCWQPADRHGSNLPGRHY